MKQPTPQRDAAAAFPIDRADVRALARQQVEQHWRNPRS